MSITLCFDFARARLIRPVNWILIAMIAFFCNSALASEASAKESEPGSNVHWFKDFSREILSSDRPVLTSSPSWTKTSNGETVLATVSTEAILLRRLADDGATISSYAESLDGLGDGINFARLVEIPGQNSIYLLAGSSSGGCQLFRYGSDWTREWTHAVPARPAGFDGCKDLTILADGSVLTLRESTLTRFSAQGQILWTVHNGDDNRYLDANDLLVDGSGVIWVASKGGTLGNSNLAAVLRFDLNGTRLGSDTFLCPSCIASAVRSLDLMPSGEVLASGTSGSGQPGFFARYASDGTRELLTESETGIGYERVTHDGKGAIYVLASTNWEPTEVLRLDPATGSVLWGVEASEMAAVSEGIVVTHATSSSIDAVSISELGTTRWTRPLAAQPGGRVSQARVTGQTIEWLAHDDFAATATCGTAPRLIAFEEDGADAGVRQPCLMPKRTSIEWIDAKQGVGVLANLGYRLATFSEDGALRWEAIRCPLCLRGIGYTAWGQSILSDDGGAWAVEARQETSGISPSWTTTIQRLDAQGDVLSSTPFLLPALENYYDVALIGTTDEVIVLQPNVDFPNGTGKIAWQRSRSDGSVIEAREYTIPYPFFELSSLRRLPDGGVSLVTTSLVYCHVICETQYVTVLRLAADGTELWRHELPAVSDPFPYHVVVLNADGSATAVIYDGDPNGHLQKREIGMDGDDRVDIILAGIPPYTSPVSLSAGARGEFLLRTSDFDSRDLVRLNRAGDVLGSVRINEYGTQTLTSSVFGELLRNDAPDSPDAVLFDRHTLTAKANFQFRGSHLEGEFLRPWRALDDGSIYGATSAFAQPGLRQAVLARFVVPGSPAESIFSNGFD